MSKQQNFFITLTDTAGFRGVTKGCIAEGAVSYGLCDWSQSGAEEGYSGGVTERAEITNSEVSIELSGRAWRIIENECSLADLVLLVSLDGTLAQEFVDLVHEGDGVVYRSIVTTDSTESCTIFSFSKNEDHILEKAKSSGNWELNDNGIDEVYFGGGSEDTEEVSPGEYLQELLKAASLAQKAEHESAAVNLVRSIAAMLKQGEPDSDGVPFEPSDGDEDFRNTLNGLIDQARLLSI